MRHGIRCFLLVLIMCTASGCGVNLWDYATEGAVRVYLTVKDFDLFALAKSENGNTVHYAVRVEQSQDNSKVKDIWSYWAIYKDGKIDHFEELMSYEEKGYGVEKKSIGADKSTFAIAGLNTRQITIIEELAEGKSQFLPKSTIAGQEALLVGVYLDLDREKIILSGVRWDDRKTPLEEEADPTI